MWIREKTCRVLQATDREIVHDDVTVVEVKAVVEMIRVGRHEE